MAPSPQPEPIAIVGSGCRFPGGSDSPSALWKLLEKPRDVSKIPPDERFQLKGYYHPKGTHHGTTNVQRAYMLDQNVGTFDATFFNISPNEAEAIDPQQRLLMEVVYEALEAGGHGIEKLRGSDTAVYVGTMSVDYNDILLRDINSMPTYFSTGTSRAILANRISYFFDWHGPSMTIDTACSSSMVALHQSVQSLRSGESRVAIAGGTELLLGPEQFVGESKMSLLSPTGQSRMWDASANGYARGDGIAAVVLKRLSDAIADGDHIECLIRQTGVNQDGKSTGLTVPSSEAQAALINRTYTKGGLDMNNPRDWPQYFEAHGTGTKAGDPREASAISQCFGSQPIHGNPLYVGSIKTIIGHTEGTAGLAGVLKACLAIRHGVIPPNMLLTNLNEEVAQYCDNLHVPGKVISWPELPDGVPRRASVNSFGFGGTNGHAILESYEPSLYKHKGQSQKQKQDDPTLFRAFPFSAASEGALTANLRNYADFLKTSDTVDLADLAWTLQSRRSALTFRTALSADSAQGLATKIDKMLEEAKGDSNKSVGTRAAPTQPKVLGVFTGQGAQWASMGAAMIKSSEAVRRKFEELDESLATLPESDRPAWRIAEELCATGEASHLNEASLSQPLCTAVQVMLVDILRSCGITFEAVIGHSSGEIGAAYAADFINAHDAIRIAYYRGLYAKHAQGPKGQKGAMMAVGTSREDAQELIDLPAFKGRIKIAAENSAASLTLSGDVDAINHAKRVFDEEKKFARLLIVDTAYHSHHMLKCSDRYIQALRNCNIKINHDRKSSTTWYSSVRHGEKMAPESALGDLYWNDNMVNAVLFADAVSSATQESDVNLAIEVGPHPALKGPALQSMESALPYTGLLKRKTNDIEAFSDALGFIWSRFQPGSIEFQPFEEVMSSAYKTPSLAVDLPRYQWDHGRTYWYLSRKARKTQWRDDPFHELLGNPSPNNTDRDLRWTNFLKANEIPWLDGHRLQGQTVFPAAGYVAMALEAGLKLARDKSVAVLEVHDLTIDKAVTFDEGANFAVETLVALTGISTGPASKKRQTADFAVYSCPNTGTADLELVSKGKVTIVYGTPSMSTLSSKPVSDYHMVDVDSEEFYSSLNELGYGYNGPFKTLSSTRRRQNHALAKVSTYGYGDNDDFMIVHPTMLDVAFQASFLAQMKPGDEQLWSLHVPTSIKCIRVNPELCASLPSASTELPLSAILHQSEPLSMLSSVDVFGEDGKETMIQVEGLRMKPFSPATAENDRPMFSTTVYGFMSPDATAVKSREERSSEGAELAAACERAASYHLRTWKAEITDEQWASGGEHAQALRALMERRHASDENKDERGAMDTDDDIMALENRFINNIDLKVISIIGDGVLSRVRDGSSLENAVSATDIDRLCSEGLGFSQCNRSLGQILEQITHRYPHAKFIEIGARAGHATRTILKALGSKLSSYTFTDPSTDLVTKAADTFRDSKHNLSFETFDPRDKTSAQNLGHNSFDVVIVSNVILGSSFPQAALENIRRLLKPGGYLVSAGITSDVPFRTQFILSGLQGWTSAPGEDAKSDRTMRWHGALRKAGFSGIDSITPGTDGCTWPFSVVVTQAVDDRVSFLRKPLSAKSSVPMDELVIVGNKSLKVSHLSEEIGDLLGRFCGKITVLDSLPTDDLILSSAATFINLADIEQPIFSSVSPENVEGLKCLFELASNIVWVTEGARSDQPYHNASIGFGRSIAYEMPHLSLQFLDLDSVGSMAARLISEAVLRLAALREWSESNDSAILWSREPEVYFEDGRLLVPRLLPENDQNARINSQRRVVTKNVDPNTSSVFLSQAANGSVELREEPFAGFLQADQSLVHFQHSILSAINVAPNTYLYLGAGVSPQTGELVIALTDKNASKAVPLAQVAASTWPANRISTLLLAVGWQLSARALLFYVPATSKVFIHGLVENDDFATVLVQQATTKSIEVTFSTAHHTGESDWVEVPSWTSRHDVEPLVPTDTTHFVNFASDDDNRNAGRIIRDALPYGCKQIDPTNLFHRQALLSTDGRESIETILEEAVQQAKNTVHDDQTSTTHSLKELNDNSAARLPLSVVNWTSDDSVTVNVLPIDATALFSREKTYLLVGLSGQLGQALSEWMSQNGAGCICLTSRNPKPDPEWQATMERQGTIVKLLSMDVVNKKNVKAVVDDIRTSCPPIAGVINGAAIFHDVPFSEMPHDILDKVMKPKVNGTKNLDEVFGDTNLDFFIVFSSLTSVLGNSGQSNYTAANAYMTGIVGQRRKRGLAATSLDIGSIIGVGFMERAGDAAREQLIRYGFMAISETDMHQLISEAIRAGAPNSGANPVVTTGCRTVPDDEEFPVKWIEDPRLQHKVVVGASSGDANGGGKRSTLPVREQLAAAKNNAEALEIIKECFAAKLANMSQLAEGEVDYDAPITELGIDSLIAVEVRGWFLKELKTDIPVLKVLGGGSVADLSQQALEKLPAGILSVVDSGSSSKTKSGEAPAKSKPAAPKPSASKASPKASPSKTVARSKSPDQRSDEASDSSSASTPSARSPASTPATNLSQVSSNEDLKATKKQPTPTGTSSEGYVKTELVSFPQSRFWFLRYLMSDQTTFNVTFYFRVTGSLRIGDLERAVRIVSNRHESLRTCFVAHEQEADLAYQKVLPSSLVRLETKTISAIEDVETEYSAMKQIPFDLESGKLMRLILLKLSPTEHYLLVNYHHILMDGVSLQNFLADLEKAYQRQPLGPPPCQVPDFSRNQRAAFEEGAFDEDIAYWKTIFPDGHPVLPLLPMSQIASRSSMHSFNTNQVECRVGSELMAKIKSTAKSHRSTTFHFYLAAFEMMLFRFTDVDDLTIGIADANRIESNVAGTIGLLLNLLTLRFKRDDCQNFAEAIGNARSKALEGLKYSGVPFDILLKVLNVPRSSSYSPFFQAFFDYRQGHQEKFSFGSTEFEFLEVHPGRTAYDMTLDITDSADGARILFRTQASLYDAAGAQLLLDTYMHILEVFATDSSSQLESFPLFSEKALKDAISVGHGPNYETQWRGGTLPHRIDQIASENPDKIAIKDGHGKVLTYGAMIDRIEAIATALQEVDVGKGSRVLVFEDATADWPCSMLAIMRIGAVYVPLDLRNPLPRLADVAAGSKPKAILVDSTTAGDVSQVNVTSAKVVNVSEVPAKSGTVPNVSNADDVAALLYTSGSTGKPKGIVVTHSGLRNEIEGYTWRWGLKAERVLQQSAFTFNHSSDQMYTGLVNGGSVFIVPWDKRGDPIEVSKIIRDEGITYTKATPAEISLWIDYGSDNLKDASSWRFAFAGGESLAAGLLKNLATLPLPDLRFFNSYGPTEISISSTKMEVAYREPPPEGRIPCGEMLPNYAAYILDEHLKPLPVGMPGELWIGGAGVSRGYLDNKELTDRHFVDNPYASPEYKAHGWTRMYRTDDIAHLQADGAMVFHNRIMGDTQVKIRGLRIELGDIESNIIKAAKGALKEAAVILRDGDPPMLIVYVVFAPRNQVADKEAFLAQLLKRLDVPQYMVPVMAIPMDRMPLSNHSKTDRKALKALPLPQKLKSSSSDVEEKMTKTMIELRRLWEGVLNAAELGLDIGPSTSFFTIGGNSLLIVRLQSRIRETFDVTIRLFDLLDANTLSAMSQKIDESRKVDMIDWDSETALPGDLEQIKSIDAKPLNSTGKVLLITGAGGFLGKHILASLVDRPDVSKIHCIGLRDKPENTPRSLAVSSPKIITHSGDLTEPFLGLGEQKFLSLAGEVDSILHMAALRSFWDNYSLLSPINVAPTKLLVQFAAPRRIPIQYVSTAGVIPDGENTGAAGSAAKHRPEADGSNGYVASRWVCEQVLERASSDLHIPVDVHRFVTANEDPADQSDLVAAAMKHFVGFVDKLEALPDFEGTTGHFEMIPAKEAAGVLANGLVGGDEDGGIAKFRHHECPIRIDIEEMVAFLEKERGGKGLKTTPGLKFIGDMKRAGLGYFVTSQALIMGEKGDALESRR